MSNTKGKVLVAMSGGVDSSVTSALLKQAGYEVVGVFMRLGSPGEELEEGVVRTCDIKKLKIGKQGCCSINDAKDAQHVAAKLDIPFYVLNFKRDFGRIINYFVDEYNSGRTPNPCVRCNDWLKFGRLWDYARSIDADFVASGHYARVEDGRLLRGVDESKDQSYVLFGTTKEHLKHMLLPVGGYRKSEIRQIASELNLPVFDKRDSQEICFVPDQNYAGLIARRTPEKIQRGDILDSEGQVVGEHEGHQHFTIGQRRGVGVAFGHPIYVVDKDAEANTITLGTREQLSCRSLVAIQTNWLVEPPREPTHCSAKIRYNAQPVSAMVHVSGEEELIVEFDEPQFAVAPGQAAVIYDGEQVLGGGWIRDVVSLTNR